MMGFLKKNETLPPDEKLFFNIYTTRAADLIDKHQLELEGENKRKRNINPILVGHFNGVTKKTKRKTSTNNPTWDQILTFPLKDYDKGQLLTLSVWDKHRSHKNYLGELRLNIYDIFNGETFSSKTPSKWYKLYSDQNHKAFVNGSLLLNFELVLKGSKNHKEEGKREEVKKEDEENATNIAVKVEPPSRQNTQFLQSPHNISDSDLSPIATSDDHIHKIFDSWFNSLIYTGNESKTLNVNDQGLYDYSGDMSDVLISDVEIDRVSHTSREELEPHQLLQKKLLQNFIPTTDDNLSVSNLSISDLSSISATSVSSDAFETDSSVVQSDSSSKPTKPKSKRFSFKSGREKLKKRASLNNFEIRNRKVDGVLFLEIVSCTDLPPVRRLKNMGRFDMDPFIVVTFGKKTFRTSWKRHNLNPIFNERLAFEVLNHEKNFDVHFLVLDKDRFSLHDEVGAVNIPLNDLIKSATAAPRDFYLKPEDGMSGEFTEGESDGHNNSDITYVDDQNIVHSFEKKLLRKKLKLKYTDTSKFKTMDLNLKLSDSKYDNKPKLKIRVRYETYDNLRRDFWRRLLEQYNLDDENVDKSYDYIELIALLDTLGSNNSDVLVNKFFAHYDKQPWSGDSLTITQIIDCLEEHVLSNQGDVNKLFEIEKCPNCLEKRLNNKHDIDVVTHFAICGSRQWSIVDKLLVSSYVTPQLATKRWFTKVLIKISYGKYQLGSNSANILVQDRTTGIILEEKMGIYVRLGIRLLYKGLDSARKKRIRAILKKLSIKQGIKFDQPNLKQDIPSFIKFHKLDLSDCLEQDPSKYPTFNEFFYRRLKPGARPVEGDTSKIVVSPADCRCTAFDTVTSASELWIKGKNFTVAKLFNGNFDNLENSNLYDADKCTLGIFRLAPQDYHRFHCPVDGKIKSIKYIDGEYYTVNPMAIRSELDVFGENIRSIISIETEHFGTVVMVPVGAMMVGSTILTKNVGDEVKRGEEMGYFKFGGSTVVLLFDKTKFQFDSDLINNSKSCIETLIRVGQSIGHSHDTKEFVRNRIDFSKLTKVSKQNLIRVITGGDLANGEDFTSWDSEKLKLSQNEIDEVVGEFDDDDIYDKLLDDEDFEEDELDDEE